MAREAVVVSEHGLDDVGDVAIPIQHALSSWFPAATHPGGFAWEVATQQLPPRIAMARNGDRVVGWAAFSPEDARIECATDDLETTRILLDWLMGTAADQSVSMGVHRQHQHLRRLLAGQGFTDEAAPLLGMTHPAQDLGATPPAGYLIRPAHPGEDTARVDVHRRAWKPVHLPFTDEVTSAGLDPNAESRFDAKKLATMQAAWLYDQELDLVIEAPDGSLAGCCTAWLDTLTGWAELEPLGIVPEHRRQGLAQALSLDVCRRVAAKGGQHVFINTAPLPYYRAPWNAYLKAGFIPMDRGTRMTRSEQGADPHP